MANDKFYGYRPKMTKSSGKEGTVRSGAEEGNTYEHLGNVLDRLNPYEFKKGMDYELLAIGCARLKESTTEEREKATEKVLKNLILLVKSVFYNKDLCPLLLKNQLKKKYRMVNTFHLNLFPINFYNKHHLV